MTTEEEAWCRLCGGNDAPPETREHTRDCPVAIERAVAIEEAARRVLLHPKSRAPWNRLRHALAVPLLIASKGKR